MQVNPGHHAGKSVIMQVNLGHHAGKSQSSFDAHVTYLVVLIVIAACCDIRFPSGPIATEAVS